MKTIDARTNASTLMSSVVRLIAVVALVVSAIASVACNSNDHDRDIQLGKKKEFALNHELGRYSFEPGINIPFRREDERTLTTTVVLADGVVRWMTKSDEGVLPPTTPTMQVILVLDPKAEGAGDSLPVAGSSRNQIKLVRHAGLDAYFEFPDTRDARGQPLALDCNLGQREMHALVDFGTLSGMRSGYCRFHFYATRDVRALIQPIPIEYLGEVRSFLPPFVDVVSRSLVRRQ